LQQGVFFVQEWRCVSRWWCLWTCQIRRIHRFAISRSPSQNRWNLL